MSETPIAETQIPSGNDKRVSGTCQYCGCTDARACPEGCFWIDDEHTVCSSEACVDAWFANIRHVATSFMRLIRRMPA
jgi:hypothetical protein